MTEPQAEYLVATEAAKLSMSVSVGRPWRCATGEHVLGEVVRDGRIRRLHLAEGHIITGHALIYCQACAQHREWHAMPLQERERAQSIQRPVVSGHSPVVRPRIARIAGLLSVQLSKAERRILTVLAQYPQGRTQTQVALLACYSSTGGGFLNAVGSLRTRGFIEGSKERLLITPDGLAAIDGAWEPLPLLGPELVDHWLRSLPKAERLIVQCLAEIYPSTLSKEEVAERTGYAATGGGFLNALGKVRTLELVKGSAQLSASEDLFG